EEASVDFCCSKVVLEHVRDVDSLSRELFRVLGPGAVMVHRIDFRDHGRANEPVYINFDFLKYSKEQWRERQEETNAWRVNDFVSLWQDLGFRVEVLERSQRRAPPSFLHPSWAAYSEDDLYCYDALIKAVKPA
ncbi:MAG: methyltransferase domain-containing protein, partial [Desulfovibrionaceae bacterium]|nr:methyltransferase domain-containing protein [Desulfovibrionaceae bacterium]